jgi:hypothetical protein
MRRRLRFSGPLGSLRAAEGGKSGMNGEVINLVTNLLFFAFGVCLVAFAFFAPRGKGELGAIAKRVALFIAGLLMMVTAILRLTFFQNSK